MKNSNKLFKIDQSIITNRTILTNLSNLDQEINNKSSILSNSSLEEDNLLEMDEFQSKNKNNNNIKRKNKNDIFNDKIDNERIVMTKKTLLLNNLSLLQFQKIFFQNKNLIIISIINNYNFNLK